jgi:23S rRNA pseudouridine2605 synthase
MPPRKPSSRSETSASAHRLHGALTGGSRDARGTVSLSRALSKLGVCSRAQALRAIERGEVTVAGRVVRDATRRVTPETDAITLRGVAVARAAKQTILLNKPRGLVTTRDDPRGRPTVYSCLTDPTLPFLAPVGRLDQASEGALLFTNDTQLANAIASPASHLPKTYHVQIDRVPDKALLTSLRAGVEDAGQQLAALEVTLLRAGDRHGWLEMVLDEGRNRQIRRMLAACDADVLRLVRVAIGPLPLGTLAKGAWRTLTDHEVHALRTAATRSAT